jgi:nucleoside-diphosphate-sugar epimerase
MRALVVGGTGYVGSTVVRAFAERGIDVVSLSRSGCAVADDGVRGDVTVRDLGLDPTRAEELRASVTHIVSCFGSVDWHSGPRLATELHRHGTLNLVRFAESCRALERFVHLSSILVLGRTAGRVTDELELGQSFRNWYEYGKYLAEREVRCRERLPWRVLRVGPIVGPGRDVPPSTAHGLLAALPALLRGYPIHLGRAGRFPCYVGDANTAGEVIVRAALDDDERDVWTWMDPTAPTLAEVLVALCSAWGVVPRIVDLPLLAPLARAVAGRLDVPRELLEYVDPWAEIPFEILSTLPPDLPCCPVGYVEATSELLRRSRLAVSLA